MPDREARGEESPRDRHTSLNERLWDLLVFVPVGIAASVADELPELAARGRERIGVQVSSARAVGQFAVKAGQDQVKRRTGAFRRGSGAEDADSPPRRRAPAGDVERAPGGGSSSSNTEPIGSDQAPSGSPNGHVPAVTSLSIPGFDTLSASQVVQRLDGLSRSELVAVRAYEASNRNRRTILNRVDQLFDERS